MRLFILRTALIEIRIDLLVLPPLCNFRHSISSQVWCRMYFIEQYSPRTICKSYLHIFLSSFSCKQFAYLVKLSLDTSVWCFSYIDSICCRKRGLCTSNDQSSTHFGSWPKGPVVQIPRTARGCWISNFSIVIKAFSEPNECSSFVLIKNYIYVASPTIATLEVTFTYFIANITQIVPRRNVWYAMETF